ncbi:MAG: hypothetical protein HQL15_09545 [Candidatus Omnitrophica bacterium]|nr:hypothetical protein [Candidatus Omnitrophota bacterium]
MMKSVKLFLVGVLIVGAPGLSLAATGNATFTVSATVPAPTSVSINAVSINATGTPVLTPVTGTALSLDPLAFSAVNQIYLPDHYFAINVGAAGGSAASTVVTLSYTEGSNPNNVAGGSTFGLGWKTVGTFAKELGTTETILTGHGTNGKKLIKDLSGETVTAAELGSGTFRLYLGIVTDNSAGAPVPPGAQTFSNSDKPGSYTGSLLVSATVS